MDLAMEISKKIKKQRNQFPTLITPVSKNKVDEDIEDCNNTQDQLKYNTINTPINRFRNHRIQDEFMDD